MLEILDIDKLKEGILLFLYERKISGNQKPVFENDLMSFCENKHDLITIIEILESEGFINVKWLPQKIGFAIFPLEGQGFNKVLELVKEKERQKITILAIFNKINYDLYANYEKKVNKIKNDLASNHEFGSSYEPTRLYSAWQDYVRSLIEIIISELKNRNLEYFIDSNNIFITEKIEELINKAIETKFYCSIPRGTSENKALEFKNELLKIWNTEATLIALNPKINNEKDYKIMNQQNINITSNDNSSQKIKISMGDINELENNNIEKLITFLKAQGLPDSHIEDLKTAINVDKQETGQLKLGEKVTAWIGNLAITLAPQAFPIIVEAVKKAFGG